MKAILFVVSLFVSFAAVADDDYTFVNNCKVKAVQDLKIVSQSMHKATLDEDTVYVSEIDDRWYNPSKYIWFKGQAKKPNGELVQVQKMYQVSKQDLKKCNVPITFTAPSDKKFVQECAAAAEKSLKAEAADKGLDYQEKSLEVTEVDDRAYNPYKYVWVKANARNKSGKTVVLTQMLQKSFFPPRPCGSGGSQPAATGNGNSGNRARAVQ